MHKTIKRLHQRRIVQAKMVQKFPDIFIEPTTGELTRLFKNNTLTHSCRAFIEENTGLIVFDSQKLTHVQAAHVLETEHSIDLPKKLKPEHQLTFVSTPVLDYSKFYIFTSTQSYKNPIEDLKKCSRAWKIITDTFQPVYVEYRHYDDARYYLQTITDKKELLNNLRFLES